MWTMSFRLYMVLGIVLVKITSGIEENEPNKLVLLVLDGFRWDYDSRLASGESIFDWFRKEGVQAHHVYPIFPSLSYPSWTSIVTGRWSETHGIVGNNMYDSIVGPFSLFNESLTGRTEWWDSGSAPVWTTATQNQVKTAVIGFSRCDVPVGSLLPDFCRPFAKQDGRESLRRNLHETMDKLLDGYGFVITYSSFLDDIGHYRGPGGVDIANAMHLVDQQLKEFRDQLNQHDLLNKTNLVVTSDHGMTEIGYNISTFVKLEDYLDQELVERVVERGAFSQISPKPQSADRIVEALASMPNVTVYRKDDFPDYWHYADSDRIPEILVLADPGCVIIGPQWEGDVIPRDEDGAWDNVGGIHGYTGNMSDMWTVFYARGPDFLAGYSQSSMELVDVYQVLAHALSIPPQPHNGSWNRVQGMLRSTALSTRDAPTLSVVQLFCLVCCLLSLV